MDESNLKPQEEILSQEAPMDAVAKAQDEAAAQKEKYVRLLAEFDNMRKRHERERVGVVPGLV